MYSFIRNIFDSNNIRASRVSVSLNLNHVTYVEDSLIWKTKDETIPATEVHLITGEKISLDILYNDFIGKTRSEANLSTETNPSPPFNLAKFHQRLSEVEWPKSS